MGLYYSKSHDSRHVQGVTYDVQRIGLGEGKLVVEGTKVGDARRKAFHVAPSRACHHAPS